MVDRSMRDMMSRPRDELAEMGARGREWMLRDFSWKAIAAKMAAAYEWLLGRAGKPDCVVTD